MHLKKSLFQDFFLQDWFHKSISCIVWQTCNKIPLKCFHLASFLFSVFDLICDICAFPENYFLGLFFYAMPPPVEKVKNQWDSTQHGVELRQQQLEDMIIDSLQWDDHREETEELMRKYEARLYMLQQARRDPLIKQVSDNQVRLLRYFLALSICELCFFFFFFYC